MSAHYAIVLGCSSGVGAAITRKLAALGYGIIGFHRGNHPLEAAAVEGNIRAAGEAAHLVVMDAANGTNVPFASAADALGECRVHVLVHALSGASVGSVLDMPQAKIERTFNNLAHSFLWWVRWLHEGGHFDPQGLALALSNPCPDFYLRNTGVIGAAKAALEAYVRILAVELEGAPRVNCLRFGTVVTPALEKVMPAAIPQLEKLHRAIVPRGRIQTSEDVANLVAMLASEQARWLNGAIIDGTGGAPSMLMDYAFHGAKPAP